MHILAVPADVIIMLMRYLDAMDLACLSGTCKTLYQIVSHFTICMHVHDFRC